METSCWFRAWRTMFPIWSGRLMFFIRCQRLFSTDTSSFLWATSALLLSILPCVCVCVSSCTHTQLMNSKCPAAVVTAVRSSLDGHKAAWCHSGVEQPAGRSCTLPERSTGFCLEVLIHSGLDLGCQLTPCVCWPSYPVCRWTSSSSSSN